MYTHAYNCTLADKNGGLLHGKQKALYLCNGTVLGKMQHLKQHPLVSLLGYIVTWDCRLAGTDKQRHTHTHTHRQTNYAAAHAC